MNTSKGMWGEAYAEKFLLARGMQVLERRYRAPGGEIDLILRDNDTIVFCEVKLRTSRRMGSALEAVTLQKQQRISRVALHYLSAQGMLEQNVRFDVIAIEGNPPECTHIADAHPWIPPM